jgi:CRP-like cAMP-binding protein
MIAKPLHQLEYIREGLAEGGKYFSLPANSELHLINDDGDNVIFYIKEGCVALHRETDDLLIDYVPAPTLLGLDMAFIHSESKYRLVTKTVCSGFFIRVDKAAELIARHHLWDKSCFWVAYMMRFYESRDEFYIGTSSYSQIRSTLLAMEDWPTDLRVRTGVIDHIQKKTNISRSVIAEVLSALRKGNYIEMHKGKLVSVNRLPNNY